MDVSARISFVLKNLEVPLKAKLLFAAAAVYLISPIDFIPDLIPGLGEVDDVLMVPTLAFLALKAILIANAKKAASSPRPLPK